MQKKRAMPKIIGIMALIASLIMFTANRSEAQSYTATPNAGKPSAPKVIPNQPNKQKPQGKVAPDQKLVPTIKEIARDIVKSCNGGKWETQACLTELGTLSFATTTTYADKLQKINSNEATLEKLKQECAASTAPMQGEYPAYAVTSAMTVCANTIYDLSVETGQKPDPDLYQLLVGSIMCLNKQANCIGIEQQLAFGAR